MCPPPPPPQLYEDDRNRLRRSGFAILNAVEKKLEKERSPKRQKLDVKPIFLSKSLNIPPTLTLTDHLIARMQGNLLFVTLRARNNRNLNRTPKEVVGAEGNDYKNCPNTWRLLAVILSGMAKERVPSQSCAHSSVWLQDHFTGTSQVVDSSLYSKWLYESGKLKVSAGLCNSNVVPEKGGCTSKKYKTLGIYSRLFLVPKPRKR